MIWYNYLQHVHVPTFFMGKPAGMNCDLCWFRCAPKPRDAQRHRVGFLQLWGEGIHHVAIVPVSSWLRMNPDESDDHLDRFGSSLKIAEVQTPPADIIIYCLPALNSATPKNISQTNLSCKGQKTHQTPSELSEITGLARSIFPAASASALAFVALDTWWQPPGDAGMVPTSSHRRPGLNGEEERQEVADAETTWIR